MPTRRVSVFLELLTQGYVRDAGAAAAVTRRVRAEMDELGDETEATSRDMNELAATTQLAKRQVDDLGDEALGTAAQLAVLDKAVDGAGDSMRDMTSDTALLNAEIVKTQKHIEDLERTMVRTGDRTLQKQITAERRWLASLTRIQRAMTPTPEPDRMAGGFANVGDLMSRVPSRWNAIGGGIAAVVGPGPISPVLGAGAAGLLSGALGTAGVAGAILMAANDPKVKAAAKLLGANIMGEFVRSGDEFVGPVLQSMAILNKAFQDMQVPEAFEKMAPFITVIAGGVGDLGRNLMPGLNEAFDRMGPFANTAADGMADLGTALGIFMDEITASPGAVMGLDAMFKILNATIISLGSWLHMLSDAFDLMVRSAEGVFGNIPFLGDMLRDIMLSSAGAGGEVDEFAESADRAADGIFDLGAEIAAANTELLAFQDTISSMLSDQLAFDQAQRDVAEGWHKITDSIKENGTALDDGSKKALANREVILDQIEDLIAQRDAQIKLTGSTDEATAAFDAEIQKLIDLGVEAGISREAMEALAGNYTVTVAFQADMSRWLTQFGSLLPGQGVPTFAGGGTTPAYEPFVVGEHGPEVMFSSKEHYVANQQMMAGGWDGAAAGDVTVTVLLDGQAIEPRMVQVMSARDRDTKRQVQGRFRRSSIEERS